MDLKELLAALAKVKGPEVIKAIKETEEGKALMGQDGLYTLIFNDGHSKATATNTATIKGLKTTIGERDTEKTALSTRITELESGSTEEALKGRVTALGEANEKLKGELQVQVDGRVADSIDRDLSDAEKFMLGAEDGITDPDYTSVKVQAHRKRFRKVDGVLEILQLDSEIPFPETGDKAIQKFVREQIEAAPKSFRKSTVDKNGAGSGGEGGEGGKKLYDAIRADQSKGNEAVKAARTKLDGVLSRTQ